jgi:acetyltransferase-like isoleucine patch superfamily enzyme
MKPEIIGGFKHKNGLLLSKVRISNTTHISYQNNLDIEDNVFIGHFNYIDCQVETHIGEGTQITNYISILNHSSHNTIRIFGNTYNENYQRFKSNTGKVIIGKYVFIGPHSVIMPGSEIGDGSIVSAYSLVKGQFPAYSILKGNPAVVVGNTKEIDSEFLKMHPEFNQYYYLNENKK